MHQFPVPPIDALVKQRTRMCVMGHSAAVGFVTHTQNWVLFDIFQAGLYLLVLTVVDSTFTVRRSEHKQKKSKLKLQTLEQKKTVRTLKMRFDKKFPSHCFEQMIDWMEQRQIGVIK
jgi:hypothetical protein